MSSDLYQFLPEVHAFLSQSPVRMFIGGRWVESIDGDTFETLDPGDGSPLARVVEARAVDVDRAGKHAERQQERGESGNERCAVHG